MSGEAGNQPQKPKKGTKSKKQKPNRSPFKSGFVPNGRRKKGGFITKKNLLKHMLEVNITVADLPVKMADEIRRKLPGFLENVEQAFTVRQVMELVQIQLLFSKSDYVKQDAIKEMKDRIDGKAVQKLVIDSMDAEPTELVLSNGRRVAI